MIANSVVSFVLLNSGGKISDFLKLTVDDQVFDFDVRDLESSASWIVDLNSHCAISVK